MVTTKHCVYPNCNSDSRYSHKEHMNGVFFLKFPGPKRNREKCIKWVAACNRVNFTVDNVSKHRYICSKHFVGGKGPTELYPDPIPATATYAAKKVTKPLRKRKRTDERRCREINASVKKRFPENSADVEMKMPENSRNLVPANAPMEVKTAAAGSLYKQKRAGKRRCTENSASVKKSFPESRADVENKMPENSGHLIPANAPIIIKVRAGSPVEVNTAAAYNSASVKKHFPENSADMENNMPENSGNLDPANAPVEVNTTTAGALCMQKRTEERGCAENSADMENKTPENSGNLIPANAPVEVNTAAAENSTSVKNSFPENSADMENKMPENSGNLIPANAPMEVNTAAAENSASVKNSFPKNSADMEIKMPKNSGNLMPANAPMQVNSVAAGAFIIISQSQTINQFKNKEIKNWFFDKPLDIIFSDLGKKNWAAKVTTSEISLFRINAELHVLICLTIQIPNDSHDNPTESNYTINILGQKVKLPNFPSAIKTEHELNHMLDQLNSLRICRGNCDQKYLEAFKEMDSKRAYVCSYTSSIRTKDCTLLIEQGLRCQSCSTYAHSLRSHVSRQQKHQKTSLIHLSRNCLAVKLKKHKKALRSLREKYLRAEIKLKKLKSEQSSAVIPAADSVQIEKILSTQLENLDKSSFMYLFLWEQLKRASSNNIKPEWHPLIVKWCTYVYNQSSSTYEAIRNLGFLALPSKNTLYRSMNLSETSSISDENKEAPESM